MISTLLDKAFKGELVPQDPNDEPASVLLEQIQEARANAPVQQKKPRRRPDMADKKTNRRKKTEPISIVQALSDAGQELSANDLFIEAGYPSDADSEQIEAFFVAVRDALINKEISKARRHDIDWFTLESDITTNEN
jgi:type I restriction enzyme S subunit